MKWVSDVSTVKDNSWLADGGSSLLGPTAEVRQSTHARARRASVSDRHLPRESSTAAPDVFFHVDLHPVSTCPRRDARGSDRVLYLVHEKTKRKQRSAARKAESALCVSLNNMVRCRNRTLSLREVIGVANRKRWCTKKTPGVLPDRSFVLIPLEGFHGLLRKRFRRVLWVSFLPVLLTWIAFCSPSQAIFIVVLLVGPVY